MEEKEEDGWTLQNWHRRIPYYIPILTWLPQYDWKANLVRDIVVGKSTDNLFTLYYLINRLYYYSCLFICISIGIVVATMLIPQCLAYATLAHVPPQVGLYTAWVSKRRNFQENSEKKIGNR